MSPLLLVHITAGGVGILAGFAALAVRKGERLHRALGTAFFVAMLAMAGLGALLAATISEESSVVAGVFTAYLVATAWVAARRPDGGVGRFERVSLLAAGGVVIACLAGAAAAASHGSGEAFLYLAFAGLAATAAVGDARVLRRGGAAGPDRLSRHLWRMCLALAIAAGSFFLGQADEFPKTLRGPHLAAPPLIALAAMAFWLVQVRRSRPATA